MDRSLATFFNFLPLQLLTGARYESVPSKSSMTPSLEDIST